MAPPRNMKTAHKYEDIISELRRISPSTPMQQPSAETTPTYSYLMMRLLDASNTESTYQDNGKTTQERDMNLLETQIAHPQASTGIRPLNRERIIIDLTQDDEEDDSNSPPQRFIPSPPPQLQNAEYGPYNGELVRRFLTGLKPVTTITISQVQAPAKKCHFLSLPPELRNRIYALVLTSPSPWPISLRATKNRIIAVYPTARYLPHPNLLATCSQIHAEATPILYGTNTFTNFYHPNVFGAFKKQIGVASFRMIRKISLKSVMKKVGFRKAMAVLKGTEGLAELEFVRPSNSVFSDADIARILEGVVGGMLKRQGGTGEMEKVLGLLRFAPTELLPTAHEWRVAKDSEEAVKEILGQKLE